MAGKVVADGRSLFRRLTEGYRLSSLADSVQHIHGAETVATANTEAIVLCVVRDGESLAEAFIEHYLSLGFKHLFFLDNGSTDRTIEIISRYEQTTLISSQLPFSDYYITFKNFLIQRFGQGKWCVIADIDELLYFPLNQRLEDVLRYLNLNHYSAVTIQMLDLFSKEGIPLASQAKTWSLDQLKQTFCFYDLNNLSKQRPRHSFQSSPPEGLYHLYGGIRKTLFKQNCFLSKEALFYASKHTKLESSHQLKRSQVADFSALFLHYKFTDNFYRLTLNAVKEENHWRNSKEYKAYLSVLEQQSTADFSLWQPSSLSLEIDNRDVLITQGFLFASKNFSTYAAKTVDQGAAKAAMETVRT
ncbi:MAG: glycosyltransferase family 2 protein [Cyanobacteria bacterium P01_D01_bin.105]